MHLQRVRVPNFRVLKDVDITFEKDYFPRIFPLGSLNGGGKSTLLQLIFVLLHCPFHSKRLPYLKNVLREIGEYSESKVKLLAEINVFDEIQRKNINLEFLVFQKTDFDRLLDLDIEETQKLYFSNPEGNDLERKKEIRQNIQNQQQEIFTLESSLEVHIGHYYTTSVEKYAQEATESVKSAKESLELFREKYELLEKITEILQKESLTYLCHLLPQSDPESVLLCRHNLEKDEIESFWDTLSTKTFLAAPPTQVFLFLPRQSRKTLFKAKSSNNYNSYFSQIESSKLNLPGLFAYDFLAIELIINAFRDARDKDFKQAVKTKGDYGNHYQNLLNELNPMLNNKKINIDPDLSGVNFTIENNGEEIDLYPEDLSHGELKRLSIYLWLKFKNIKNSIVLIDEIETALHPDWQYQIVRDLEEWEPSNQYILATHSYELCQALTPAHVKELEPKLIKQKPDTIS
ncbi:MAG: AAA family ATPase [Cyanobacteriota bacterium]|nr:AAA family ATPase [Cyanobacteriota bacterium]